MPWMGPRWWGRHGRCFLSVANSRWSGLALAALLRERVIAAQAHPTLFTRNLPDLAPTAPLDVPARPQHVEAPKKGGGAALSSIEPIHSEKVKRGAHGGQ